MNTKKELKNKTMLQKERCIQVFLHCKWGGGTSSQSDAVLFTVHV
jgi:hypothetical protein